MMNYHVLTLFPEMILDGLHTSIIGRAIESGYISLEAVNIRDFADNKHNKVDDYPYGGGAGMVMQAEPVYRACEDVQKKIAARSGKRSRVIYVTPQGAVFNQSMAEEFAKEEDLIFLCGHYEGIDERVLEASVTDYVSIGDYVLTGGELPAMVMIDAISRLVPNVLSNEVSAEFESFHENLLEYPQYSRPEEWQGKPVPPVLLSGNHTNIEGWRREHSIMRTRKRRPDLFAVYQKEQEANGQASKRKINGLVIGVSEGIFREQPFAEELLKLAEEQKLKVRFVKDEEQVSRQEAWALAVKRSRLKRTEILAFADSVLEVQAARNAGVRVVYFPSEPKEKEPKDLVYYQKIGDWVEGMAILRKLS